MLIFDPLPIAILSGILFIALYGVMKWVTGKECSMAFLAIAVLLFFVNLFIAVVAGEEAMNERHSSTNQKIKASGYEGLTGNVVQGYAELHRIEDGQMITRWVARESSED